MLAQTETDKTKNTLYEISFDGDNPDSGAREVSQAVAQGPILIAFPGNGFESRQLGCTLDEQVMLMAKKMRRYLEAADVSQDIIRKMPFYVITYHDSKGFSDKDARTLLYKKHGRNNMPDDVKKGTDGFSEEEQNPAYIESLYDKIIRPRISRLNGKVKCDVETAARNMAQVTIFAHCHGAYTALKLEEIMRKNMQKLGYTNDEILKIQKQITVVAYAPACPLGVSKMNFVSFKSLNDTSTEEGYNNVSVYTAMQIEEDRLHWADKHILNKKASEYTPFDFKFSFYPGKQGNVFMIKQKNGYEGIVEQSADGEYFFNQGNIENNEHNNTGKGETEDSKLMYGLMVNAIGNACRHAFAQAERPELLPTLSVKELVVGTVNPAKDAEIFEKACQAGAEQSKTITKHITQLLTEQNQKH